MGKKNILFVFNWKPHETNMNSYTQSGEVKYAVMLHWTDINSAKLKHPFFRILYFKDNIIKSMLLESASTIFFMLIQWTINNFCNRFCSMKMRWTETSAGNPRYWPALFTHYSISVRSVLFMSQLLILFMFTQIFTHNKKFSGEAAVEKGRLFLFLLSLCLCLCACRKCVREAFPWQLCADNCLITVFIGPHFEIAQNVWKTWEGHCAPSENQVYVI